MTAEMLPRALLAAAAILAVALYWPGLAGPFVYDDALNLAPVLSWHRDLTPWLDVVLGNESGALGRPISMLSFLATGMWGVDPFHFKAGNLLVHVLTGWLGWLALRKIFRLDLRLSRHADTLAAITMALWLLHPVHASTVLYAVQRMAQLSTLFAVAAVLAYLAAREALEHGDRSRGHRLLFGAFPLLLAAGLLSKENAAVAPALCLVTEIVFPVATAVAKRTTRLFLAIFVAAPAVAGAAALILKPDWFLGGYALRDFTPVERLLTQSRVLFDYLAQLVFPRGELMTLYTDDYPVSKSLFEPWTTAPAVAALVGVSLAAIIWRRRAPLLCFGWLFFLAAHGVESTLLPLDLYYDHRNYLPSIGLIAGLVGAGAVPLVPVMATGRASLRIGTALATMAAVAFLTVSTSARAHAWQSREQLLREALTHHPGSLRANLAQIDSDVAAGRRDLALARAAGLEQSPAIRHRLLARIERLTIECQQDHGLAADRIESAFVEMPDRIGMDEVQSASLLLQRTRPGQCGLVDDRALGTALARLADAASAQPDASLPKQQLRYASALALARSGYTDLALPQARLAWQRKAAMEVGFLLVWLQVERKDVEGARQTTLEMAERLKPFSRASARELGKARLLLEKLESDDQR